VHRDYIVNETDRYSEQPPQDLFVGSFFEKGEPIQRGRKFYPTLTLGDDGKPVGPHRGVHVQLAIGDGTEWETLEAIEIQVLPNELGIRLFSHSKIPEKYKVAGGLVLRVTATVENDHRLTDTVSTTGSKLAGSKQIVIQTQNKFKYNIVESGGSYESIYSGSAAYPNSNAADDSGEIALETTRLSTAYGKSRLSGTLPVYVGASQSLSYVGKRITTIDGRDVGFKANTTSTSWPIVTGFVYDVQSQKTSLILENKV